MSITPAQIRAARALLNITAVELAKRVGVSDGSISMIENGKSNGSLPTLKAIEAALMAAGVDFTPEGGVTPKQNRVLTYDDYEGFASFRRDVLTAAQMGPLDVCVSNVDESQFNKWGAGTVNDEYRKAMAQIKTVSMRILVKEGDQNFVASKFAEYRWIQNDEFGDIPFYIFGEKTAIISFTDNNFQAFIIDHAAITSFFRQQFDRLWNKATIIKKD